MFEQTQLKGSWYQGPFRSTWRLLGAHRKQVSLGIALRLVHSFFVAMPAILVVWIIDRLREGTLTSRDGWIGVGVVGVAVVGQFSFVYASNYFAWVATFKAVGEARIRTLEHLQKLPLGTINRRSTGDITAALTSDIEAVSTFAHHSMLIVVGAGAIPVVVFVALAFIDLPLALAVAASVVVAVPLFIWTNKIFTNLALERGDLLAEANGRIIEYIRGIAVARAFNATGERNDLFRNAVADVRGINDRLAVKLVPLALAAIGTVQLGIPLVIMSATYWWFGGRIDQGTALVFFVLMLRVYVPLLQAGLQVEPMRIADASLIRIGRLMDLTPQAMPETQTAQPKDSSVAFEGVSFGYEPDQLVLADFTFTAKQGTTTAIVGPSGVGKSTILNLIARFWDPDVGTVSIGGVDVRKLSADQLFGSVTAVLQDVYLFQGTIRENIAGGRDDATDEAVMAAAAAAQAHNFIMALEDGYQTRIGEGGMTLSGGERQRVSIARALLKDAPVILLDEATASMDPINERATQQGLAALVAERTLLVVAHRLSTIRSADQILVLDAEPGQPATIVQRGTHDELIELDGLYRHLWRERERASRWRIAAS